MARKNSPRGDEGALTRREVLAGGLALAAGALTAGAIAPEAAIAADGDPVSVGQSVYATNPTVFTNTSDGTNLGLIRSRVTLSDSSDALQATCWMPDSYAIRAANTLDGQVAVKVEAMKHGVGVLSYVGIRSVALKGVVDGLGTGVRGQAGPGGCGVQASAPTNLGGVALDVEGAANFSRSGRGKIPKGHSSVNVTVAGGLVASALVLVTLQNAGSGVYLKYARRVSSTQFTAKLNKAAPSNTYFAWFVVG
jgi:hypothetical protein